MIIDLTLTLDDSIRGFARRPKDRVETEGWNSSMLEIYSHAGTHMDAPVHFGVGTATIDAIPVMRFLSTAWLVDVSDAVSPGSLIEVMHLKSVVDKVQPGQSVLLRTDWSRHLSEPEKYRSSLPRISTELARWFAGKAINLVGVEQPSVADVNNLEEVTRIHRILLEAGTLIVEGLGSLKQLPSDRPFTFGAFPLKIEASDGSPCRAFAILED